jgi:APA family basic amino acid/polyamine antiporter
LAANHPVSGGTYEYAHRWLNPTIGFVAGWMFLTAKAASAATAALGFAGYAIALFSDSATAEPSRGLVLFLAWTALVGLTVISLTGIKRSAGVNTVLVSTTFGALTVFVLVGVFDGGLGNAKAVGAEVYPSATGGRGILEATALMFVAYTGYGRVATLGEEVKSPRVTIPRAILSTLVCTLALYLAVAAVAVWTVGADAFAAAAKGGEAPLQMVAQHFSIRWMPAVVAIGATVAMLGVLFNLVLGLSRVALALGRRGDIPAVFSKVSPTSGSPVGATLLVAGIIALLISVGNVRMTWSISAFTVLVYYGITNACAIRLAPAERLYHIWPAWIGLLACLGLAFCVAPSVWLTGCGWIAAGLIYRVVWRARFASEPT